LSTEERRALPGSGRAEDAHGRPTHPKEPSKRAFYTALGHTAECFADPLYLEHVARRIRWALGRAR
jgi:hypothetical protein